MRDLHNIEKSKFRRGEYIGYAAGLVWRITKANTSFGTWCAKPMDHSCGENQRLKNTHIFAFRLADLSEKLDAFSQK